MANSLHLPANSRIRSKRVGTSVTLRWPAPANWFERLGPDRVFALTTAVCGPAALAVFFINPLWAVLFLFAILAGAGIHGTPLRLTGIEEIELTEEALVVRRYRGVGLFARVDPEVPAKRRGTRELARFGRGEGLEVHIEPRGRGQEVAFTRGGTRLGVGAALDPVDQEWLRGFVQDWLVM